MATSFTMTRDNIIKASMRKAGILASGATPSASETTDAAELLNAILKMYDAAPWFKWFIKSASATVSTANGTASYDLAADTQWVETVTLTESGNFQVPLVLITQGEYASIVNKARLGIPTHAFISTDLATPKIYLWPTPNATLTVNYWYRRKVDIFDNSSDTGDLPQEWYMLLVAKLAVALGFEMGKPLELMQMLIMDADSIEKMVMGNQVQQITGQEVMAPSPTINSPRTAEPTMKRLEPGPAMPMPPRG